MNRKLYLTFFILLLLLPICLATYNPAATLCIQKGHGYAIETDDEGNERGVCITTAGRIEEWRWYSSQKDKTIVSSKIETVPIFDELIKDTVPVISKISKSYPTEFDWRDHNGGNWLTPIKDQGTCGSCWAFSSVGIAESQVDIFLNNPEYNINLAEQDLISCSGAGDCSWGYEDRALAYMKSTGIVRESCFGYTATNNLCSNKCANWNNELVKIDYARIAANPESIKEAISNRGPIIARMITCSSFDGIGIDDHTENVYSDTSCWSDSTHLNSHLVNVVGYNDAGQYWIGKNSWGSGWGDGGYFKIAYQDSIYDYASWNNTVTNHGDENRIFFLDYSMVITSTDIDNDGTNDKIDCAPFDATLANNIIGYIDIDNDAIAENNIPVIFCALILPDGYVNTAGTDNCPTIANPTQADTDTDGIGDACDDCLDVNHNGICDEDDIFGCTDEEALNYNSLATVDDGSCEYLSENIPIINSVSHSPASPTYKNNVQICADVAKAETVQMDIITASIHLRGAMFRIDETDIWCRTVPATAVSATAGLIVNYSITAENVFGSDFAGGYSYTYIDVPPDHAPIVGEIVSQRVLEGQPFYYFDLDDYLIELDGDEVTWSYSGNEGYTVLIDSDNRVMISAPEDLVLTSHDVYSKTITFTATDNTENRLFSSDSATFTIQGINKKPIIEELDEVIGFVELVKGQYQVLASDPDRDTLVYSLSNAPTGMTINSRTGLISWTPKLGQSGKTGVVIKVSDLVKSSTGAYTIASSTTVKFDAVVQKALAIQNVKVKNIAVNEGGSTVRLRPGESITMTFTLKNNYNQPLTGVLKFLKSTEAGLSYTFSGSNTIAPGETKTYTLTKILPTTLADRTYPAKIYVSGKNAAGTMLTNSFSLGLLVEG